MGKFVNLLIILILGYIWLTQSYPYGAPSYVCDSMMPSHGVNSMSCQANYVIRASKSQYTGGDTIQSKEDRPPLHSTYVVF